MSNYTYTVNKWGYKVFCDGKCILWAETDHRANKRYNKKDIEDFTNAAKAYIHLCEAIDKYNNNKTKEK